jgi:hypothetical protein
MTTATMLTRVRTLLDEASAGLWVDTEIYSALADGQNAIIDILIAKYKSGEPVHNLLQDITLSASHTSGTAAPSGYIDLSYVTVNGVRADIVSHKEYLERDANTYLDPVANSPVAYVREDGSTKKIYFDPTTVPVIYYFKTPTEIASGVEPTLSRGHEAIVQYAFSFLLLKNKQTERSMAELEKFYKMVAAL